MKKPKNYLRIFLEKRLHRKIYKRKNKINSIYQKIIFIMDKKKYIYANVQIPIEIDADTYEYTPLQEYIVVTFHHCEENPRLREPSSPYLKESMKEIIKRLFHGSTISVEKNEESIKNTEINDKENTDIISTQTIAEILSILPNEIKKKLPSKNSSFKQKLRNINKRTTAKVYHHYNNNPNISGEEVVVHS